MARGFLPFNLAAFFLFDGEQVSEFAERAMAAQVRTGIEGLLGIALLKELAEALRKYASVRRREKANVSDDTIETLERELEDLRHEKDAKEARQNEIVSAKRSQSKLRDTLIRELAGLGVETQDQLQEQMEQLGQHRRTAETAQSELEKLMADDIALALTGTALRQQVGRRLAAESIREKWEAGKQQANAKLDRFLGAIGPAMAEIVPALTAEQTNAVIDRAKRAWEHLWSPAPENCADDYRHPYLTEPDRNKVIEELGNLERLRAPAIVDVLNRKSDSDKALAELEGVVIRTEGIVPLIEEKCERLKNLNSEIQTIDWEISILVRDIVAIDGKISSKNADHARLLSQRDQAQPSIRRATWAVTIANMVDEIVANAVPDQTEAIARAMTEAHRSMAHKKDSVERIAIDADCTVKLLTEDNIDIRDHDLSAGEKQIFTQALIAAVASVSGRDFPMVVDTPLGRLDVDHRKGVLKHLVGRGHQVILLSTDTEVVDDYLKEIEPHVQKKYRVVFDRIGDIGRSRVIEGYFGDEETAA